MRETRLAETGAPHWVEQQKLVASDGSHSDIFGSSVALSGDTALVGAWKDSISGNSEQGSAYVCVRNGTSWTEQQKLVASDGAIFDGFGFSVAVSGDTAIVGVPTDDIGANLTQGSAYVFVRNGNTWVEQQKLLASDGAATASFGHAVALSGDTALIAAQGDLGIQGSAYVFVRNGTTWTDQQKLLAPDGLPADFFGYSVALSGDTALVGAIQDDTGTNSNQGSAYVFVRSGSTWSMQQKLVASDGIGADELGGAVALDSDTAIVGAFFGHVGTTPGQGAAYVFVREGTTWTEQQKLFAADGAQAEFFGTSVGISGNTVLVSAPRHEVGGNSSQGAAYLFERSGVTWTLRQELVASDGAAGDVFGSWIALSGSTALIGASWDAIGENKDQGSAYVFVSAGSACTSSTECGGNSQCVDGVCCASSCSGQCEFCAVPGSEGECRPWQGAPRSDQGTLRPSCEGAGTPCAGQCDGVNRNACSYPGAFVECSSAACENGALVTHACDGAGKCLAKFQDCKPPALCDAEKRVCSSAPTCEAGSCATECDGSTQCAPDAGIQKRSDSESESGCGCRVNRERGRNFPAWALLALTLVLQRRRWGESRRAG